VCVCPCANAKPPLASAAAIPFLDEADIRLDFLDFLPSGGLRDALTNAELDLIGRRSLLETVEPDLSRPLAKSGADTTETVSAGPDMVREGLSDGEYVISFSSADLNMSA
jgi:hypothetical protein